MRPLPNCWMQVHWDSEWDGEHWVLEERRLRSSFSFACAVIVQYVIHELVKPWPHFLHADCSPHCSSERNALLISPAMEVPHSFVHPWITPGSQYGPCPLHQSLRDEAWWHLTCCISSCGNTRGVLYISLDITREFLQRLSPRFDLMCDTTSLFFLLHVMTRSSCTIGSAHQTQRIQELENLMEKRQTFNVCQWWCRMKSGGTQNPPIFTTSTSWAWPSWQRDSIPSFSAYAGEWLNPSTNA